MWDFFGSKRGHSNSRESLASQPSLTDISSPLSTNFSPAGTAAGAAHANGAPLPHAPCGSPPRVRPPIPTNEGSTATASLAGGNGGILGSSPSKLFGSSPSGAPPTVSEYGRLGRLRREGQL